MLLLSVSAKLAEPAPPAPDVFAGAAPPPAMLPRLKWLLTPLTILVRCQLSAVSSGRRIALTDYGPLTTDPHAISRRLALIIDLVTSIVVTFASYAREASSALTYSI